MPRGLGSAVLALAFSGSGLLALAPLVGGPLEAQASPPGCRGGGRDQPFEVLSDPVLEAGPAGSWDAGGVLHPAYWGVAAGVHRIAFIGRDAAGRVAIGFAHSEDGLHWVKAEGNPVVTPAMLGLAEGFGIYEIVAYPTSGAGQAFMIVSRGPDRSSFRYQRIVWDGQAMDGPKEVFGLGPGGPGAWDHSFSVPRTMIRIGDRLVLFFDGSDRYVNWAIGRAESTDGGSHWVKFDDPETAAGRFAESDPVFRSAGDGADIDHIFAGTVSAGASGLRLLYTGGPDERSPIPFAIGEAHSSDHGRTWRAVRSPLVPALPEGVMSHPGTLVVDQVEYILFGLDARKDFQPLGLYVACRGVDR